MDEPLKNAYIRETLENKKSFAKISKFFTWVAVIVLLFFIYNISNIFIVIFAIIFIIIFVKTDFFKPIRRLKIFDFYRFELFPWYWNCPNCNESMKINEAWKCDKCFYVNTKEYYYIYTYCHNCYKQQKTAFCEHCHKEFLI